MIPANHDCEGDGCPWCEIDLLTAEVTRLEANVLKCNSPGWICTAQGVGSTAVFKANSGRHVTKGGDDRE